MIPQRLARLRQKLAEQQLEALLVSAPENRRYLSGFTGSAGHLWITANQAHLATDFRYVEQVRLQCPDYEVFRIENDIAKHLGALAAQTGVRRVGLESAHISYHTYQSLAQAATAAQVELVPTMNLVEDMRLTKDQEELHLIQEAIALADAAFAHIGTILEPGMTERQAAWEIERFVRERGGDAVSFDVIVAAGPHGALPHWRPSDRPIKAGEPVVFDLGARVDGYCSDLTRTLWLGEPDETFTKVYRTVLQAQRAAEEGMRTGMSGAEADALARHVVTEAGYGEHFGHGLGHGVGLLIHEAPWLRKESTSILEENTIFTVEPGIYLSGWGGVRLEDIAVMNRGGAKVLSKTPKLSWE